MRGCNGEEITWNIYICVVVLVRKYATQRFANIGLIFGFYVGKQHTTINAWN
jgi:hypothetical protein